MLIDRRFGFPHCLIFYGPPVVCRFCLASTPALLSVLWHGGQWPWILSITLGAVTWH